MKSGQITPKRYHLEIVNADQAFEKLHKYPQYAIKTHYTTQNKV